MIFIIIMMMINNSNSKLGLEIKFFPRYSVTLEMTLKFSGSIVCALNRWAVGSNPSLATMRQINEKAAGNHFPKSTFLERTQSLSSARCCKEFTQATKINFLIVKCIN